MVFFVLQKKIYKKSNIFLFCSYNIISFLFNQVGLTIEHGKSEFFHFSRLTKNFNLPLLDLSLLESPILWPKESWKYLGFIFDIIFVFMPTKLFQLLRIWRYWEISLRVCYPPINNYYIKHVFCLSYFIVFLCSTSRMFLYTILSRSLEKYN